MHSGNFGDVFEKIHRLLTRNMYKEVIGLIFNKKNRTLVKKYACDRNHAWYIIGDCFLNLNNYVEASKAFRNALIYRRNDCQAMFALAYAHSEQGKPELAKRYLRKIMMISGWTERCAYNLANAYFDCGEYEKAIKHYREVVANKGELMSSAKKNIANARMRMKR